MGVAARQSMWKSGFDPLNYCFISRYNCKIVTDFYAQHTVNTGVEAVFLFMNELTSATGDTIFGHSGTDSSSGIDSQDFRFFIASTYPNCNLYFDRGNGRSSFFTSEGFNILNTNWHKVSFQGRSSVTYDKTTLKNETTVTSNSASCRFCFFQSGGWTMSTGAQNDVAIRYVRIYDTSTGQDLAYFVPDFEGMRDLVADKVYKPVNADARFEVVKWKSLSEVEEWKDLGVNMNEG